MTATTTATLPAANPVSGSKLTLAKTGTVDKRPAMIAHDGPKVTVVLVLKDDGNWGVSRSISHGGIRGLGLALKELDEGTARNADQPPVFDISALVPNVAPLAVAPGVKAAVTGSPKAVENAPVAAAPEKAKRAKKAPVAATPAPAPAEVPPAPAKAARAPKAAKAPAAEAPAAKVEAPAGPRLDPAILAHYGPEFARGMAETTDLDRLRKEREVATKAGAPAEVIRAITLRAGEVAMGLSLASIRKASKPAADKVAPTASSTRAPPTKKMDLHDLIAAGIVKVGDVVHLRGKPDHKTTIKADGSTADGTSLAQWGKANTGWPSINVYANIVHARTGKLLADLRTA
jgi:hypothetical protein